MVNNIVILKGRAVATPTLRQTNSGTYVTDVRMAIPSRKKNEDGSRDATFINVDFWGKLAEIVCDRVMKGDEIYVQGELKNIERKTKDDREYQEIRVNASEVSFGLRGKMHEEEE